jgi:uncharacterized protein (TIGR03066 family)
MKAILTAVAAVVVFAGAAAADEKDKKIDAGMLVGKWELTKSTDEKAPKGATVDFTKDNKVTISFEVEGQKFNLEGTYKVTGDKLSVKLALPDGKEQEETDTIKSLSGDKLVLLDKANKETEFTKKK